MVSAIAEQYGVNRRTLEDKWLKWGPTILSEGLNPSLVVRIDKEYRGGSNRLLTVEQERALCTRLYHNRADLGLVISDNVIEHEALILIDELQADNPINQHVTKLSRGWITGFKKRWGWRSERISSHPVKPPPDEAHVKRFATNGRFDSRPPRHELR